MMSIADLNVIIQFSLESLTTDSRPLELLQEFVDKSHQCNSVRFHGELLTIEKQKAELIDTRLDGVSCDKQFQISSSSEREPIARLSASSVAKMTALPRSPFTKAQPMSFISSRADREVM